jgi:hypothetical protein
MSYMRPENLGALGDLFKARCDLDKAVEALRAASRKVHGASADDAIERDRLIREIERARVEGYERRDEDGQRLYELLGAFDSRDGTAIACVVQAAREGWERSHLDMDEDGAWDHFDRVFQDVILDGSS